MSKYYLGVFILIGVVWMFIVIAANDIATVTSTINGRVVSVDYETTVSDHVWIVTLEDGIILKIDDVRVSDMIFQIHALYEFGLNRDNEVRYVRKIGD